MQWGRARPWAKEENQFNSKAIVITVESSDTLPGTALALRKEHTRDSRGTTRERPWAKENHGEVRLNTNPKQDREKDSESPSAGHVAKRVIDNRSAGGIKREREEEKE